MLSHENESVEIVSLIILPTDRNECGLANGGCEHVCTNTDGSYDCSCNSGFQLGSNGRTCKGEYQRFLHVLKEVQKEKCDERDLPSMKI